MISSLQNLIECIPIYYQECNKNSTVSVRFTNNKQSYFDIAKILNNGSEQTSFDKLEQKIIKEIINDYRFSIIDVKLENNNVLLVFGLSSDSSNLHFYKHINDNKCLTFKQIIEKIYQIKQTNALLITEIKVSAFCPLTNKIYNIEAADNPLDNKRNHIVFNLTND